MIKKTICASLLVLLLAACGNGNDKNNTADGGASNTTAPTGNSTEPTDANTAAANGGSSANTSTNANNNGGATGNTAGNNAGGNTNAASSGGGGKAMTISKKDADAGLALITKSDCLTCHKVDQKVVGPAYQDVAAKYPATQENIDMLANKVISGGAGNWGQIPMTPHPQISKDDAKQMVKFVLAQKK